MKIAAYGRTFEVDEKRVRGMREHGTGHASHAGRHTAEQGVTVGTGQPRKTVKAPALSSPPLSLCFTLWGQIRGGKNNICITRTGHRYPNKKFEQWRAEMLKQCPAVAGPFTGPLHLIVDYVKGDRLRRDMPAMLDALLHLFGKAGYFVDDSQVVQVTWTPFPLDRKMPRCTVTLSPMKPYFEEEA